MISLIEQILTTIKVMESEAAKNQDSWFKIYQESQTKTAHDNYILWQIKEDSYHAVVEYIEKMIQQNKKDIFGE